MYIVYICIYNLKAAIILTLIKKEKHQNHDENSNEKKQTNKKCDH